MKKETITRTGGVMKSFSKSLIIKYLSNFRREGKTRANNILAPRNKGKM
jgi:hypothetical protein